MIHVRIDGGDGGGHGQHRLDGIAAFGQHLPPGFDGRGVRRADDAPAVTGCVQIHGTAQCDVTGSAKPRFFSSASALGSRPRKAL